MSFQVRRSGSSTASPVTVSKAKVFEGTLDALPMEFPSHTLICGATNSGKTKLLLRLLQLHRTKFHRILFFVGAGVNSGDYDFVSRENMYAPEMAPEVLEIVIKMQEDLATKGRRYKTLCVFDDFIGTLNLASKSSATIFQKLATSGRHMNLSCIFLSQKISASVPTVIRDNIRHWFITRIPQESLKLASQYQSCYENKVDFCREVGRHMEQQYTSVYWDSFGSSSYGKLFFLAPVPLVELE